MGESSQSSRRGGGALSAWARWVFGASMVLAVVAFSAGVFWPEESVADTTGEAAEIAEEAEVVRTSDTATATQEDMDELVGAAYEAASEVASIQNELMGTGDDAEVQQALLEELKGLLIEDSTAAVPWYMPAPDVEATWETFRPTNLADGDPLCLWRCLGPSGELYGWAYGAYDASLGLFWNMSWGLTQKGSSLIALDVQEGISDPGDASDDGAFSVADVPDDVADIFGMMNELRRMDESGEYAPFAPVDPEEKEQVMEMRHRAREEGDAGGLLDDFDPDKDYSADLEKLMEEQGVEAETTTSGEGAEESPSQVPADGNEASRG